MKRLFFLTMFCLFLGIVAKSQTHFGINNPQLKPDTVSAVELASIQPDSTITSFEIVVISNGYSYESMIKGNVISENTKFTIRKLKPGSKVFIDQICASENGQILHLPDRVYIIR